eukprot:GDKJ01036746.1.p1 GENE.GDKJ01036746.1~~GDKJ01036746.1.p1  ORF type:complete len:1073 (+),score=205.02 GDKJ01036746.1:111-3221(+)
MENDVTPYVSLLTPSPLPVASPKKTPSPGSPLFSHSPRTGCSVPSHNQKSNAGEHNEDQFFSPKSSTSQVFPSLRPRSRSPKKNALPPVSTIKEVQFLTAAELREFCSSHARGKSGILQHFLPPVSGSCVSTIRTVAKDGLLSISKRTCRTPFESPVEPVLRCATFEGFSGLSARTRILEPNPLSSRNNSTVCSFHSSYDNPNSFSSFSRAARNERVKSGEVNEDDSGSMNSKSKRVLELDHREKQEHHYSSSSNDFSKKSNHSYHDFPSSELTSNINPNLKSFEKGIVEAMTDSDSLASAIAHASRSLLASMEYDQINNLIWCSPTNWRIAFHFREAPDPRSKRNGVQAARNRLQFLYVSLLSPKEFEEETGDVLKAEAALRDGLPEIVRWKEGLFPARPTTVPNNPLSAQRWRLPETLPQKFIQRVQAGVLQETSEHIHLPRSGRVTPRMDEKVQVRPHWCRYALEDICTEKDKKGAVFKRPCRCDDCILTMIGKLKENFTCVCCDCRNLTRESQDKCYVSSQQSNENKTNEQNECSIILDEASSSSELSPSRTGEKHSQDCSFKSISPEKLHYSIKQHCTFHFELKDFIRSLKVGVSDGSLWACPLQSDSALMRKFGLLKVDSPIKNKASFSRSTEGKSEKNDEDNQHHRVSVALGSRVGSPPAWIGAVSRVSQKSNTTLKKKTRCVENEDDALENQKTNLNIPKKLQWKIATQTRDLPSADFGFSARLKQAVEEENFAANGWLTGDIPRNLSLVSRSRNTKFDLNPHPSLFMDKPQIKGVLRIRNKISSGSPQHSPFSEVEIRHEVHKKMQTREAYERKRQDHINNRRRLCLEEEWNTRLQQREDRNDESKMLLQNVGSSLESTSEWNEDLLTADSLASPTSSSPHDFGKNFNKNGLESISSETQQKLLVRVKQPEIALSSGPRRRHRVVVESGVSEKKKDANVKKESMTGSSNLEKMEQMRSPQHSRISNLNISQRMKGTARRQDENLNMLICHPYSLDKQKKYSAKHCGSDQNPVGENRDNIELFSSDHI